METINITNPGNSPVDGDSVTIVHDNGSTETKTFWQTPIQEERVQQSLRLSKLEFINRLTDQELEAIYSAAEVSIPVRIWLDKFKLAEYIEISDSLTIAGITKLELAGLINQGRAAEILNNNP